VKITHGATLVSALSDYYAIVGARPELFRNPPNAGFTILLDEAEIREAQEQAAQRLKPYGGSPDWATVGVAYRDQYLLILRDAVRFPDGSLGTYIRAVTPYPNHPGVVILPVCQGQVVLITHFRHATRTWHLEIPRGFGDSGSAAENARRELAEEIAATASHLTDLGFLYSDTGVSDSRVALFHAEIPSYGEPDRMEAITDIRAVPLAEFESMIATGEVDDAYALAAYARAKARQLL
jgi:ADP-ribose pyrophosphatase